MKKQGTQLCCGKPENMTVKVVHFTSYPLMKKTHCRSARVRQRVIEGFQFHRSPTRLSTNKHGLVHFGTDEICEVGPCMHREKIKYFVTYKCFSVVEKPLTYVLHHCRVICPQKQAPLFSPSIPSLLQSSPLNAARGSETVLSAVSSPRPQWVWAHSLAAKTIIQPIFNMMHCQNHQTSSKNSLLCTDNHAHNTGTKS